MADRLREKHDLLIKLGALFGPLLRLIELPDQYDPQDRSELIARYCAEYPSLQHEFRAFCQGQAGHDYAVENHHFMMALVEVQAQLIHGQKLEDLVPTRLAKAREAIDAIPIPRTSVIVTAGSPFTAYRKLRELCEADAAKSLTWLDPYMDAGIFSRYLGDVRPGIVVTLISSEPPAAASKRDKQRWEALLDVSRLYAQERGQMAYRFLNHADMHDRWVVLDAKRIYALGGSAKDAAALDYFTIASVEGLPENLARIQKHLDDATEFFGPATPKHR